jgi:hypothetical protein
MFNQIVDYVKEKYESEDLEMCKNCGSKVSPQVNRTFSTYANASTRAQQLSMMEKDNDYVWCTYQGQPNNRGDHPLVGHVSRMRYGYGHYGARVLVHRSDIWDGQGRAFGVFVPQPPKPKKVVVKKPVQLKRQVQLDAPKSLVDKKPLEKKASFDDLRQLANQEETPKDVTTDEVIDLQTIPGISSGIAKQLADRGIQSVDARERYG